MLKKIVSSIFVGLLITTASASAAINVLYSGVDGFLRSDDSTGLTQPANGSQTALAQLIFTPNNAYGAAGPGGSVLGVGESVLQEIVITDSAGTDNYGVLPATSYSGSFSPGWLYVRVFDQGTGLGGSGVVGGTWYYNSPLYATINNITPETPDALAVNGGNPSSGGVGDFLSLQVVPEPATFALLGLGGLVLAIRRRFSV